jgi:isopentenyl-diphosphate delta-isomerase
VKTREQRKLEHLHYALTLGDSKQSAGFEDVQFLHQCLSPVNPERVDLRTRIAGIALDCPIFIDAITGGADAVTTINKQLAQVAARTGIAMAVGSQYGAVREHGSRQSFAVVRKENPDGIIFANVSALATPAEVKQAVDMLAAAAVEIHLNVAQELFMSEGDHDFAALWTNLQHLREQVTVPIIIKETGCGMAAEQIKQLQAAGFTCFNVAGAGGTSFAAIETARSGDSRRQRFAGWGIPTVWSLLEARQVCSPEISIIASGGIRDGWQVAKALALGAAAVGMAGNILALLEPPDGLAAASTTSVDSAVTTVEQMLADVRDIMVLTGAATVRDLQQVRLIFTGRTLEYLQNRSLSHA